MHKDWVISVSFGELMLKGKNRSFFVNNAVQHIMLNMRQLPVTQTYFQMGKFFLELPEEAVEEGVRQLQKVFGLAYITPSRRCERNFESICALALEMMEERLEVLSKSDQPLTFKVEAKRADKAYPLTTPELCVRLGGILLDRFPALSVDVHEPTIRLHVDVRNDAFLFLDRFPGLGGLPGGSGGRGLLLLSGGIDSPVAGYAMARRGLALGGLHFHSYPYTSERAQDKAIRLAEKMGESTGPLPLYLVNLRTTYEAIHAHCDSRYTTLLSRRMMMRIAEALADRFSYDCFITGESLGQVASQTIQGISVVNAAAQRPILRPLIASDKNDIIAQARAIGTYDISIEPYDDCCSIFAPDAPNTRPKLSDVLMEEAKLDTRSLLEEALDQLEVRTAQVEEAGLKK